MSQHKLQSLTHRITRGVFIIAVANLVFVVALVVLVKPALIESMSKGYITDLSDFVKDDIRYTLLVQDDVSTQQYLERIAKFPWVQTISLYDTSGGLLNSVGESNWNPNISEFNSIGNVRTVGRMTHKLEAVFTQGGKGGEAIAGLFHLSIDRSPLARQVDTVIYLVIFALIVGSILLWHLMQRFALRATQSIRELNASINAIEPDRHEIHPISIVPDSIELANVQSGVNSLLSRISLNRSELENRVRERTIDLATAMENNNRAEAVRRSLVMNLSHDLKTPLSSIIMHLDHALEMFEDSAPEGMDVVPFLESSRQSTVLLWDEIKTLLQYSSSTDHTESIVLHEFDISDLVSQSINSSKQISNAARNTVNYEHSGREIFSTSSRLLTYVLDNLITNAHKACKDGVVSVRTSVDVNNILTLVVHDDGVGIPIDEREHIFEKHFMIDTPGHVGPRGMGIGLSLAKFWIDQLGGTIDLISEEGEYTQFTISIRERYLDTVSTSSFL